MEYIYTVVFTSHVDKKEMITMANDRRKEMKILCGKGHV